MIYLVIFFISAFFSFMYQKAKKKTAQKVFAILAILLPTLLAAFRNESIGTDTLYYIKDTFMRACTYDSWISFIQSSDIEIGYLLINFIVSRITHNIHVLYFVLQFIIQFLIFKACTKMKNQVPVWFSYLSFLLLYYNRSLNMCRQTIALSMVLYAYQYLKDRKFLKGGLLVFSSLLFHTSAIIGIFIYIFMLLIPNNKQKTFVLKLLIYIVLLVAILGYNNILLFLIDHGILSSRYTYYLADINGNIIWVDYALKLGIFAISLFLYKFLIQKKENRTLIYFLLIDFTIYHLGFVANYAQRISYYFGYFNIFLIPQFSQCFQGQKQKIMVRSMVIGILIVYWYLYYAYLGADATVPYVSIFS